MICNLSLIDFAFIWSYVNVFHLLHYFLVGINFLCFFLQYIVFLNLFLPLNYSVVVCW